MSRKGFVLEVSEGRGVLPSMQFSKCCDSEVLWWPFRVLHAKLRYEFCLENICFFATRYVYKNATLLVLGEDKLHIIVLQIGYSLSLKIWFHIKKNCLGQTIIYFVFKGGISGLSIWEKSCSILEFFSNQDFAHSPLFRKKR